MIKQYPKWLVAAGVGMISAAALAQPALAPTPAPVDTSRVIHITQDSGDSMRRVVLALNQAVVLELDRDVRDVVVANPTIADAVVKTPRRIFLMSLKAGETNALFLDAQGVQIANLQISVGSEDINRKITQLFPGSHITATPLGGNIVLSGTARSAQEAGRAQAMAEAMAQQSVPPAKVINNIAIDQRQQVLIQVRVSEMSRTISKQFGFNALAIANAGGVPVVLQTDNQFSLAGRALSNMLASAGNTNYATCLAASSLCPITSNQSAGILQALEQVGLVHMLAEPNLTAVSGETAKFLAGGEFPVPTGHDLYGNITVEYKQFGVGLAFTPVVLSAGRISLQISTEVSELTNTGALTESGGANNSGSNSTTGVTSTGASCTIGTAGCTAVNNGTTTFAQGLTIPALAVRRTETTVELPSGGSIAIGGLIQQEMKQNLNGLPGIENLPVLGALFRSRDFQNNETELVVTVTAYLVNPVAPKMLARPDDGFAPATDLETTLLGRLNAVYGKDPKPATALDSKSLGYIIQ
jgi:pilus assembly protein CpaC